MTIISIIFIAFLPGLVWLLFFLREDCHPEPRGPIIYTFLVGAAAALSAVGLGLAFQNLLPEAVLSPLIRFTILLFGLALIEEVVKLGAAWFATDKSPDFNEPVDAMIYISVAALGFATTENILVVSGILTSPGFFAQAAGVGLLRFVGATLLHVLSSALVGYYWAKVRFLGGPRKLLYLGILLGTAVHAFFNYLILAFQNGALVIPSLFLAFAAFFIFTDFEKLKHGVS